MGRHRRLPVVLMDGAQDHTPEVRLDRAAVMRHGMLSKSPLRWKLAPVAANQVNGRPAAAGAGRGIVAALP